MRRNSSVIALLVAAILLGGAVEVRGQATTSLERLEIVFWPEYDRPEVLVMLRAWLPADAHLPTFLPLPIPSGVEPSAVAKRGPDGQLVLAAHTVHGQGVLREVSIAADVREIRLEYYAPLKIDGAVRSYDFDWPGLLEIRSLIYEVQQPIGATDVMVVPAPSSENAGFDGLTYLSADLGQIAIGDEFSIVLGYRKQSDRLTLEILESTQPQAAPAPVAAAPVDETAVQPAPRTGSFPWLALIPVVLIGALIVVWFLQSGSKR